jgi:hypothetical protein
MQAAVMIHKTLVEEGVLSLPCKLAAVVIHRMLWCKEGCASYAVMHASCCHDPQNALVEEGCAIPALPCKLCCCDSQNALVQGGCAIPALSCQEAAVMIHRMLWWKKVCYPALPSSLLL